MGGRMQSQAHRGCREGRRAWATGCRQGGVERSTQEGGGLGQAKGKHGEGDETGDTEGQEVAAEEDGQQGRRGRGEDSRGHGPRKGGPGIESVAAEAGTLG